MRLIPCVLLSLLAATAAGQSSDFYCSPNYATPEGGAEITIRSFNSRQFKAPQVYFGGVPSPHVTVESGGDTVKAVAPAHAIGVVDVTMLDNGAFLQAGNPFAFAPLLEEILIPIAYLPVSANYGTRWVSEISVFNDSDDAVTIDREICSFIGRPFVCNPAPRRVPPHSLTTVEPWSKWADYPWMFLEPPADHAARLHFTVRLRETSRDPDGPGTEIPVVRTRDFQQQQVWLPSIPTSARFRSTLRVYTRGDNVIVRVKDNATGELLKEWSVLRFYPTDSDPFGTVTFPGLLEVPEIAAHEKVRIEVSSPQRPVWALLTLTDNESQRVQVFTPH